MYERFFGFRDQPFRLTPDPKYLYLSSKHREGYAHLLYALREGSGFVAVTGEVGTGKTTLVRSLLRDGHPDIAVAYIFNPVLSSIELLQTINAEFGLPSRSTSKKELTDALNAFLLAQKSDGGRAVVIVDEAQNLDPTVLEQLRLLSNLETETDKLLQIILLGQPELRGLLERPDLRQLSQRISLRWHLESLDRKEASEYIQHRVRVAGGRENLFDPRGLEMIHELSGGIPRLINVLAHRALLVTYTKGAKRVTPAEVELAAVELEQCRIPLRTRKHNKSAWIVRAAAGAAVAFAAGAVAFVLVAPLGDDGHTTAAEPIATRRDAKAGGDAKTAKVAGEKPRAAKEARKHAEDAGKGETKDGGASDGGAAAEVAQAKPSASAKPSSADTARAAEAVDKLAKRLARADNYAIAAGAISRLIELWTGRALSPAEVSSGSLDLQLLGARRGLRYLSAELSPRQLETLDLPAVAELRTPDQAESRYVLVESVDDDTVRLHLDKPYRADRAAVEALWAGNVHLLWRDAERLSRPLTKGSKGPAVEKLQTLLVEAGYLKEKPNGDYDEATEKAVRRLQSKSGLNESGDATTLTQIILYNAIDRYERPELRSAGEGEDRVARSVS